MTSIVKAALSGFVIVLAIATTIAIVNHQNHKEVKTQLEDEKKSHKNSIESHKKELKLKNELIEKKEQELEDKNKSIEEKSNSIKEKEDRINELEKKNKQLNKSLATRKEQEEQKRVLKTEGKTPSVASASKPNLASRDNSSPKGGKESYFTVTAYTADPAENGGWNITASGTPLVRGTCAVDPKVIPLGTKLHVEGYGYCTALDTGGAIKGNKIDVLIPNKAEMRKWGRQTVKVKILGK